MKTTAWHQRVKGIVLAIASSFTLALGLAASPAWAGDPFRTTEARKIGEHTEAAFEAMFQAGNYQQAKRYLIEAEAQGDRDPLAFALRASIAYTEEDWETLNRYANKTLAQATSMQSRDPLRGQLYTAVGHFLVGAYLYEEQGPFQALTKLQPVLQALAVAEQSSPQDPELNLLKGYLDLLLAVNLPLFDPEDAIARFGQYAAPPYLVDRGLALAYRDLEQYDRALPFAEQALRSTPNNPEIHYLKAQILYQLGKRRNNDSRMLRQAVSHFEQALALSSTGQLPESITEQIEREHRLALERIAR